MLVSANPINLISQTKPVSIEPEYLEPNQPAVRQKSVLSQQAILRHSELRVWQQEMDVR